MESSFGKQRIKLWNWHPVIEFKSGSERPPAFVPANP